MDVAVFTQKVRACERRLYHTARCILRVEADCEDAVQEALIKAWRNIGALKRDEYFDTWLTRILINECRALLRKKARRAEAALNDELPAPRDSEAAYLLNALDKLNVKYRLPLVMHYLDGFSILDMSRALRLPVGAVRWRLTRAKKLLGEIMDGEAIT